MSDSLVLVSHKLCPYVQRAAIILEEKGVPYIRKDIDLSNKPAWFLKVSPLGKTPVLLVNNEAIFESAVICEYLEDVFGPSLHPKDPLERARHRSWMEFGSSLLNTIAEYYSAEDDARLVEKAREIRAKFQQLEAILERGPYFDGEKFSMVDAVFGPVFRYFDTFEELDDFDFFTSLPKVSCWRKSLAQRPSIKGAVDARYPKMLEEFIARKSSALSPCCVINSGS